MKLYLRSIFIFTFVLNFFSEAEVFCDRLLALAAEFDDRGMMTLLTDGDR